MRIALIQMAVTDGDVAANVARAEPLVRQVAAERPDVILLPELWTSGYAHDRWPSIAAHDTPRVAAQIAQWARETGVAIGGSMITQRDGPGDPALVNRFTLTPGEGGAPVVYDKAHLFGPMRERELLSPGARRVQTTLGAIPAALSICYDLRFPAMYRAYAHAGATLFLVVSAWPHPREVALRTLAMARAIENQGFLALCNRVGPAKDGSEFCGGSMVISPTGEILLDLGGEERTGVVEIEIDQAIQARSRLQVLHEEVMEVDS